MKQGIPRRLRPRVWFHPAPIRVWLVTITFLTCFLATHSPSLHQWLHGEIAKPCAAACSSDHREVAGGDSRNSDSSEDEEHTCGLSVLAAGCHLLMTGLEGWTQAPLEVAVLAELDLSVHVSASWLLPASRAPPALQ